MSTDSLQPVDFYGYTPSRPVAITFMALFAISTALHIGQAIRYRVWWSFYTICLCGIMEALGWMGRLWSTYSLFPTASYQMQVILCIIAPTPLLAANFIILGSIIKNLGPSYSRLSPRMYSMIFCSCDVFSLVIQAAGAVMAAAADTPEQALTGSNVMLFGIAFQLFVIVVYSLCGVEFFVRYAKDVPFPLKGGWKLWEKKSLHLFSANSGFIYAPLSRNLKLMTAGLIFNTTFLFIRAIFRLVELGGGWDGPIMANQLYFNVLDGTMIILAIYTHNFFHPGMLLEQAPSNDSKTERMNEPA